VVEPFRDSGEIANSITVAILEGLRLDLVDDPLTHFEAQRTMTLALSCVTAE